MNDVNRIRKVLEELKPMGRMDGDMIDCAGEARTIEGWRQECERLRGENERLRRQLAQADRNCEELQAEREAAKRLRDEANAKCEQLRRAQRGDATAGENEALRIIIRHLAKLL